MRTRHKHRKIYEDFHKVKLLPGEVIHHLDGNHGNDDPLNLFKFSSQREHAQFHLSGMSKSQGHKDNLSKAWKTRDAATEETRRKMKVKREGKKPSLGKTWSLGNITKQKMRDARKGKVWVTNGSLRFIPESELQSYLDNGYKKGRKF